MDETLLAALMHQATLSIFFGPRIPTGIFQSCRRKKKIEVKSHTSDFFLSRDFFFILPIFFTEMLPIWEHSFWHVGGKKKKPKCEFLSPPVQIAQWAHNASLSVCLSVRLYICPSVCLPVCLSVWVYDWAL